MFKLVPLVVFISLCLAQDDKFKENESITKLDLSGKNLKTLNDYDFSNYPQLEELDLSNNLIEHIRGDKFKKNKLLKKLNLSGNILLELPKFATLLDADIEELNLSKCNINEFPQSVLDGLTKLKVIDLSNNPLQSIKSISFTNLLNLEKLILPDFKDKETITEICDKSDQSQITIEDAEHSLKCSDINDGKWVETPNSINLETIHKDAKENETVNNIKHEETPEISEANDEPVEHAKADLPAIDQPGEATHDEQPLDTVSDDQEMEEKIVSKTSVTSNNEALVASNSQSDLTLTNVTNNTQEVAGNTIVSNSSEVVKQPEKTIPLVTDAPEPTNEKKIEAPLTNIHRSLPAPEPDTHVPSSVSHSSIQLNIVQQNSDSVSQTQPKTDNKPIPTNTNENSPAQQANQSESEASTGASSSQGTGTNILIFLVIAVVISGIAAFGYRFYKTRTYRPTNTQEPVERELQEIVTDKKSNGPSLDNVLEEEPLMEKIETSEAIKGVNERNENHSSHNPNHAKPYIPITSIAIKEDA